MNVERNNKYNPRTCGAARQGIFDACSYASRLGVSLTIIKHIIPAGHAVWL